MWIRRAGLGLHGKARAAVAGHHLNDRIDARMRPASQGEVFYRQAGLPQPSYSIHKHKVDYKHGGDIRKMLMVSWSASLAGMRNDGMAPSRTVSPGSSGRVGRGGCRGRWPC